jgi:hypothetical protein
MTHERRTDQPDLHKFISRFGSYAAVSAEGWREWDQLSAKWRQSHRDQLRREIEISKRRARNAKATP